MYFSFARFQRKETADLWLRTLLRALENITGNHHDLCVLCISKTFIDWCCSYHFIRNDSDLVALLEALFVQKYWCWMMNWNTMTGRCIYEKKNENGENGILFEDHLRSGQGRAWRIDKLDGARTMMDDQMMPECQRIFCCAMGWRGFWLFLGQSSSCSSVAGWIAIRRRWHGKGVCAPSHGRACAGFIDDCFYYLKQWFSTFA